MHYWIPELVLGVLHPEPQMSEAEKFGGLPWGLPQDKWPRDEHGSYVFFAQLRHHPERANLGKEGRVAYLFFGGTFDHDAVVFADCDEISSGRTPAPNPKAPMLTEAWITRWEEGDDGLPESMLPYFMSEEKYYSEEFKGTPMGENVPAGTYLGSVPDWVQSPYDAPSVPPYKFIGQFTGEFDFEGPAPTAEQAGCAVEIQSLSFWSAFFPEVTKPRRLSSHTGAPRRLIVHKDGSYSCADNYIGDGLAYLFVNPDPAEPVGKFFIQVT